MQTAAAQRAVNPGALVAVGALVKEGAELTRQGHSYYVQAGAKFLEAREAAGGYTLEYKAALHREGVAPRTERQAIQLAREPEARAVKQIRDAKNYAARTRRDPPSAVNDLAPKPMPSAVGEIYEAVRGFKAATARFFKHLERREHNEARRWHTTALQHFSFLLGRSNLPALMGMSPDAIVGLLNFYTGDKK